MSARSGIGYDSHRFAEGRRLLLGGVEIPHDRGLLGHSDADVLLHAIADALLGAAALGDLGTHFPSDDPAFAGADSLRLLREIATHVRSRGYAISSVDATVVCEAPRLGPYVARMRESIGSALGTGPEAISVKAKTNEGLGDTGTGQAISALAAVLITR